MENYQIHFTANSVFAFITNIIILIACVTLFIKMNTAGTKLILIGCVLRILGFLFSVSSSYFFNGSDSYLLTIATTNYFNTFAYLIFGIGLLMFTLNDIKEVKK